MKKIYYVAFIICLLVSNFFVPTVSAKTLGDLKNELNSFVNEYENNKAQQKLSESEINNIKSNINSINNSISDISNEIDALNEEIYNLGEQIKENEEEIKEILAFVQVENGESAYLEYAFGAADFTDFIYRIAVSEQLTTHNDELIENCKSAIEQNNKKTEELNNKTIELANKQVSLKSEMSKIQTKMQELDEEGLSIEEEIKAKKSEIKIYEDKGCKDNENISTCGKSLLPPDTSFWRPLVKGRINGVLGLFGKRDCKSYMSCYHYGMDLGLEGAGSGNVKIYSAAAGIVVYIVPLTGGYQCAGNKVYIQHNVNGKIYTTGYLHMHEVYVKTGQTVTKDTVIGTMGGFEWYDTCSDGGHLHFEISTGTFADGTYSSNRFSPSNIMNLPKTVNTYWYDRTSRV